MADHGHTEHAHSLKPYFIVYSILMIGLAATVWVAYHDFGIWANPIALGIATTKAVLVVLIFMHVKDSPPIIWLTICIGLAMLGIGLVLILGDYLFRGPVAL
ncbi:cytochrome C oxidase subunit IV family protein [bacterium]|nr:cytochrome C oxidase subunit IV family protein [bacterium]